MACELETAVPSLPPPATVTPVWEPPAPSTITAAWAALDCDTGLNSGSPIYRSQGAAQHGGFSLLGEPEIPRRLSGVAPTCQAVISALLSEPEVGACA